VLIDPGYKGFRIEVTAAAEGERWNADLTIRRTLSSDEPHHERVSCYKPTAEYAEWAGMLSARRWIDRQEFRRERAVITLDQRKVSLILEFLKESFGGCSVYVTETRDRVAQFYRIVNVNDTTGKILHRVFVSRAFLDDHGEAEIIPALQNLGLLLSLRLAGGRPVTVKSQIIEIEEGA
jgi:hypothetical protein